MNKTAYKDTNIVSSMKDRMIFHFRLIARIIMTNDSYITHYDNNTHYNRRCRSIMDVITSAQDSPQYHHIRDSFA